MDRKTKLTLAIMGTAMVMQELRMRKFRRNLNEAGGVLRIMWRAYDQAVVDHRFQEIVENFDQ